VSEESSRLVVANLNARIRSWWTMVAVFVVALATGGIGSVVLFAFLSFVALREFITLTPTRRGDHRTLFWAFFIFIPIQYLLVGFQWYGLFAIFIPVYAFLFIPMRSALAGDTEDFLARTAKIQWGLMIAVYCVSHAPALLMLEPAGDKSQGANLLFFLILVVQLSDVLQYAFGKTLGRHRILPSVSPNKTWEGAIGGIAGATLVGTLLWWATPFTPWAAAGISLLVCLAGFAGGLVMSAIKRDRGVKDFGTLIEGHGGVLDRIDSLCFAAPLFFHVVRYFYS
jgi:phosphatidate cytidylyltransferase